MPRTEYLYVDQDQIAKDVNHVVNHVGEIGGHLGQIGKNVHYLVNPTLKQRDDLRGNNEKLLAHIKTLNEENSDLKEWNDATQKAYNHLSFRHENLVKNNLKLEGDYQNLTGEKEKLMGNLANSDMRSRQLENHLGLMRNAYDNVRKKKNLWGKMNGSLASSRSDLHAIMNTDSQHLPIPHHPYFHSFPPQSQYSQQHPPQQQPQLPTPILTQDIENPQKHNEHARPSTLQTPKRHDASQPPIQIQGQSLRDHTTYLSHQIPHFAPTHVEHQHPGQHPQAPTHVEHQHPGQHPQAPTHVEHPAKQELHAELQRKLALKNAFETKNALKFSPMARINGTFKRANNQYKRLRNAHLRGLFIALNFQ